jgi:hypothetical protein
MSTHDVLLCETGLALDPASGAAPEWVQLAPTGDVVARDSRRFVLDERARHGGAVHRSAASRCSCRDRTNEPPRTAGKPVAGQVPLRAGPFHRRHIAPPAGHGCDRTSSKSSTRFDATSTRAIIVRRTGLPSPISVQ